jgi:hypothetical protein
LEKLSASINVNFVADNYAMIQPDPFVVLAFNFGGRLFIRDRRSSLVRALLMALFAAALDDVSGCCGKYGSLP